MLATLNSIAFHAGALREDRRMDDPRVLRIRDARSAMCTPLSWGQRTWDIIQGNLQRRRLMMPPRPVLAQLAWEVLTIPPTDEGIQLLTEVVEEAQEQNLEPAEIETRLRGTASGTG